MNPLGLPFKQVGKKHIYFPRKLRESVMKTSWTCRAPSFSPLQTGSGADLRKFMEKRLVSGLSNRPCEWGCSNTPESKNIAKNTCQVCRKLVGVAQIGVSKSRTCQDWNQEKWAPTLIGMLLLVRTCRSIPHPHVGGNIIISLLPVGILVCVANWWWILFLLRDQLTNEFYL